MAAVNEAYEVLNNPGECCVPSTRIAQHIHIRSASQNFVKDTTMEMIPMTRWLARAVVIPSAVVSLEVVIHSLSSSSRVAAAATLVVAAASNSTSVVEDTRQTVMHRISARACLSACCALCCMISCYSVLYNEHSLIIRRDDYLATDCLVVETARS